MSRLRIWITAEELMKRWSVGPLDLTSYVSEGKLTLYHYGKTPFDFAPFRMSDEDWKKNWHYYINDRDWFGKYPPRLVLEDYIPYTIFKYDEVVKLENEYLEEYPNQENYKERKLRANQRHRENARAIAASLWDNYPAITINDMAKNYKINVMACERKVYKPKTIRNWIKDLCPNRKPGRRPKT